MDRSFHLCSTTTVELWTHLAHVASSTLGARRSCGQRNRNPLAGSRSALRAYTYPAGTVNGMGEFWSTSGSSGSSINGRGTWWKHVRERLWLQWLPLPVADRRLKSNHHQNYEKRCLLILIKPMLFHLMRADTGFADFSGFVIKAHLQIRTHLLEMVITSKHMLYWCC